MPNNMEDIMANQQQIVEAIEQLLRNFKKDSAERKTPSYIKKRLETLDSYWQEFQTNHMMLSEFENRNYTYFSDNIYQKTKSFYIETHDIIQSFGSVTTEVKKRDRSPAPPSLRASDVHQGTAVNQPPQERPNNPENVSSKSISQGNTSKLEEMLRKQKSNFKALSRAINQLDLECISEKWEYEDILKTIQARWSTIDSLHWEIDSELYEQDEVYEREYDNYEQLYNSIKKSINNKMWSIKHRENSTPKMDIPIFTGNYHKWVSFKDLFCETIHNNRSMSGAQKMQFLKSKLKGEAERLIQHLNISSDNYQICWDILNHRFSNTKLIFSSHINIILSIHTMQHQSDTQIKNIFDTTNECLNAIKNLGIDISTWDPLIIHLLSQKLDPQTHGEYIESLDKPRELPKLSDFLQFLENKYTSLEASRRKQNFPKPSSSTLEKNTTNHSYNKNQYQGKPNHYFNKNNNQLSESNRPFLRNNSTKSFVTRTQTCILCKGNHGLFHCKTFLESNAESKRNTIQHLKLCKNCLYNHKDKACFSEAKCRVCQGRHNTLLHDAFAHESHTDTSCNMTTAMNDMLSVLPNQQNNVNASQNKITETLLATAMVRIKGRNGSTYELRALIDQGSQVSLVSENAAQMLGLPRTACNGSIFGIGTHQHNCKGLITIRASSLYSNFTFERDVLVMKNLINHLPNQTFAKPSWSFLQNIQLADPDFNVSRPVDLLLGADVYAEIIMSGIIKEESYPIAQQTQLGWILCGNMRSYHCNVVMNNIDDIQRFWTVEDISESETNMSSEDELCIQQYKSETYRREDGRYVVSLPLKSDINEKLGQSKHKAAAQFYQLEKRFSKNKQIALDYKSFIDEYIELGHMRKCINKKSNDCILSHHCVLRNSPKSPLRVVFNASAKTSSGHSLNDLMYTGPNLQQDLFTLILRWRQYEFALNADIQKMFRQILCHEKHIQYQKILWRDSPQNPLDEYELTTVTYGLKAAPFLAMMTLRQLAQDERSNYPVASEILKEDFYMDDLLSGSHTLEGAIQLKTELTNLLKSGGFNLCKWSSNKPEILDSNSSENQQTFEFKHQESTKTLGLRWQPSEDQFMFQNKIDTSSTRTTKRSLLSDISKIYDPLGWLSPLSTKLKIIFQNVWTRDLQWDDDVPEDINSEWKSVKESLSDLQLINIPRWIQTHQNENIELHGFCDASTKAYSCVIYCRSNKSTVTIVAGKSRLVPVNKTISLPRLELSAAYLLSKLMKVVLECLSNYHITLYGWSDSTAVLGWLHKINVTRFTETF